MLQGARLTAWELAKDGFDVTLVTDSMVGELMRRSVIDLVLVGADRIARSGDVANKIGTYGLACLAHAHGVPFYVAAPWSTVDLLCTDGQAIPIERRDEHEVLCFGATRIAPEGVRADNPAFDVTPARLVRAIVTERGEASPPSERSLGRLAGAPSL
jgi:methylthioribose-1-phosphate isomerase